MNMRHAATRPAHLRSVLARALLLATALLAPPAALPGELQVFVTTPEGKPAPDVVVSLLPLVTPAAATPVPAADPVLIVQKDIRFHPYVTAVPLGARVRFVNRDRFDHHIKSAPGGLAAGAAASGDKTPSAEIVMDAPGATGLACHIHGSMRGHIYVSPTPWVAVTDTAGRAVLPGAPEGEADVRLWHPDQLVAQPNLRTTVGSASTAQAQLNFTPRRRTQPRKGEYEY